MANTNTTNKHFLEEEEEEEHYVQYPRINLGQQPNPWGQDGSCLGLKILCGVLGLLVVVLLIVLIVKMVHKDKGAGGSAMPSSPAASQMSTSLQGGFDFQDASLMSTS